MGMKFSALGTDDFVVVDIETTGFSPQKCNILEIAALKVSNGEIVDEFCSLIKQDSSIPIFIRHMTGICDDEASRGRDLLEILNEFVEFAQDHTIVGHNINFDMSFINCNLQRHLRLSLDNERIDTIRVAKELISDIENYRLGTLADYFGINSVRQHRAADDVRVTHDLAQCLSHLNDNFREAHEEQIQSSLRSCDTFHGKRIVLKTAFKYVQPRLLESLFREAKGRVSDRLTAYSDILIVNEKTYERIIGDYEFDPFWSDWLIRARDRHNAGELNIISEREVCELLGLPIVERKSASRIPRVSAKDIVAEVDDFDEAHPLFGKNCVFTGVLDRYDRRTAMQMTTNVGGICQDSVVKSTDYLILGDSSYFPTSSEGKSSKQKRAEQLISAGLEIRVIPETVFYNLLKNDWGESDEHGS